KPRRITEGGSNLGENTGSVLSDNQQLFGLGTVLVAYGVTNDRPFTRLWIPKETEQDRLCDRGAGVLLPTQ
ncbi:hypothetical protein ACGYJM_17315, partial [Sulfitobacter sp. 1A09368]